MSRGDLRVFQRRQLGVVAAAMSLLGSLLLAPAPGFGTASQTAGTEAPATAGQAGIPGFVANAESAAKTMRVKSADLSQFRPGHIISDAKFFDRGAMTEMQIQQFLESKVPRCDAGYTCLKDWYDTSRSTNADAMCGAYSGGVRERASRIIYKVAQACGISPQVILATLQKEQGLVTHNWPSEWRYTIAMGQGCPDTAACDTRYYGFFNQVYGAAWQFKRYANPPGTSNYFNWYAPGKTWNVRFHPNAACGTSPVYIENQATANLYYYTPYQPNAAALAAGYGEANDACSSYGNRNFYNYFTDWFGSTAGGGDPFGNVESLQSVAGAVRVTGWAADPDTTNPIEIHVYVGGVGRAFTASNARPDVGAAFPSLGSMHGFDVRVPVPAAGTHNVCTYAINVGTGTNRLIACGAVTVTGTIDRARVPFGSFDSLAVSGSVATAKGWAIDPDTSGPIAVRLTVGNTTSQVSANQNRADVGAAYPTAGPNHGFATKLTLPVGTSTVCATAVNNGIGGDAALGCRSVTIAPPLPTENKAPIGNFESLGAAKDSLSIGGWALDPNVAGPIEVHIYVDGVGRSYTANVSRPDIAAAYPGHGDKHGFTVQVPASPGSHQVCVYAIDNAGVSNPTLGCRSVTVSGPAPAVNKTPIGNFESVGVSAGSLSIGGWALDPNVAGPIEVHVYVNGVGRSYTADVSRPDIAAAYPSHGDRHGFVVQVPASSGTHQVCVYAIDDAGVSNPTLGCRSVTVSAPAPVANKAPIGNFEGVSATAGTISASGWAIDPDTTSPIEVHVYVDGIGRAYPANLSRTDVAAAYPAAGDAHGFNASVAAAPGLRTVCIYAIDAAGGSNTTIGCRSITVP